MVMLQLLGIEIFIIISDGVRSIVNFDTHHPGTIFRLPLRRRFKDSLRSEISDHCPTLQEVCVISLNCFLIYKMWGMMNSFIEELPAILPLLNNTRCVKVFKRTVDETVLLAQVFISLEDMNRKNALKKEIAPKMPKWGGKVKCKVITESPESPEFSVTWVLSQVFRAPSFPHKGKFPLVTVMKHSVVGRNNWSPPGNIFSYLPLPMKESFPVVLSAPFELEPDRRQLAKNRDVKQWNAHMITCLTEAYVNLVDVPLKSEHFWICLPTATHYSDPIWVCLFFFSRSDRSLGCLAR